MASRRELVVYDKSPLQPKCLCLYYLLKGFFLKGFGSLSRRVTLGKGISRMHYSAGFCATLAGNVSIPSY
jgi:hypothetical protein